MSAEVIESRDSFDHITGHSRALFCVADLIEAADLDKLNEEAILRLPELLNTIGIGILHSVDCARKHTGYLKE